MAAPRSTPLGAVVRGALAGAIGTLTMDLVWFSRHRRSGGEDSFADWEFATSTKEYANAGAPAQVGKRLAEGLFQTELPDETAGLMTNVVHWATGVAWGAAYGVIAGSASRPRVGYGLLLGPAAWLTGYLVLPAADLYQPIWKYDAATLGKDLSAHVAFGLGTAAAFRLLARPLTPPA